MAPNHSTSTAIALTIGLVLCAGTAPALARGGGGGHGAGMMHSGPMMTGMMTGSSRMLAASPKAPPGSGSGSGSSSSSGTSVVISNTGPAPLPTLTPSTGPSDNLPPRQELTQIAPPLPQLPEQFSTGGSTGSSTLALSPGGSSSPSESAPSAPGGGGKSLADCMGFWDRATHMNKQEWRAACIRTMQEYPSVSY